jgi:hypothetical protein
LEVDLKKRKKEKERGEERRKTKRKKKKRGELSTLLRHLSQNARVHEHANLADDSGHAWEEAMESMKSIGALF